MQNLWGDYWALVQLQPGISRRRFACRIDKTKVQLAASVPVPKTGNTFHEQEDVTRRGGKMTPNFEGQPDHKVIVPKERWFMPPASVEPKYSER